jgi:hypothetical protein
MSHLLAPHTCIADGLAPFEQDDSLLRSGDLTSRAEPVWIDVGPDADPVAVAAELSSLGLSVTPELALHLANPDDRPQPQLAHAASRGGPMRFWAFGASVEGSVDSDDFAVLLQPVGLLVEGSAVVTWRLAGVRHRIDYDEHAPAPAPALELERLLSAARSALLPLVQPSGEVDRDAVFFAILEALVVTLFGVRAELGQVKVAFDNHYFEGLVASRRRAAGSDIRSQDVARAAREASHRVDRSRRALASIQRVATIWRRWFDDFKPSGLPFKQTVWLPETTRGEASEHLVDRIYQVRNDLRSLRAEVHQSMTLLATADTGGQLLAVRALLDRTESARGAAVVAGAVTLIIATIGLSAAVATIPSANARFLPISKALAVAGLAIFGSVAFGGLVALLSRQAPPLRRRSWTTAAFALFAAAVAVVILAAIDLDGLRGYLLIAGVALAGVTLLTAAYAGDFGQQRHAPLLATACAVLLEQRASWSGSAAELAREFVDRLAPRRPLISTRGHRTRRIELDGWLRHPQRLERALREEAAWLEEAGFRVKLAQGEVTISREEDEEDEEAAVPAESAAAGIGR